MTQEELQAQNILTTPATLKQRKVVAGFLAAMVGIALLTLPTIHGDSITSHLFIFSFASSVAVLITFADLATCYLLFVQFVQVRIFSIAALAATYLFVGLICLLQALTLPGIFSTNGLFQANTQTAIWLYVFWHAGLVIGILVYVTLNKISHTTPLSTDATRKILIWFPLLTLAVIGLCYGIATYGSFLLPELIHKMDLTPMTTSGVGPALLLLTLAACIVIFFSLSGQTTLHLLLRITMVASLLDVALVLYSMTRYNTGWYLSRANSLIAALAVLAALFNEVSHLYQKLGRQNELLTKLLLEAADHNEQLHHSGERFKRLMDANIIGVSISNETSMVEANDAFLNLVGYSREELENKQMSWATITSPEDVSTSLRAVKKLRTQGWLASFEKEYVRKDGTRIPAMVGAARLQEEPLQWVAFAFDLTALKTLERQLEIKNTALREQYLRAEKANRLKSEFLANMSHELRTPLNAIIGFTDLLAAGIVVPAHEAQQEYLEDILSSARHLLQLVNDVLDLAKIQAGKIVFLPESVILDRLISNVCDIMHPLAARKQVQILTLIEPALGNVVIDPARFKQVLYNYLSNAIKFTPEQGTITIRISAEGPATFRLQVEDTGIGIEPEDIGRLFVEFQQLDISASKKYQGTGLGLALTRRLVEAQGGQVGVSSLPGKGCTFFAILPRAMSPIQEITVKPDYSLHEATLPGVPTILIIEDELQDQQRLVRICTEAGYKVEVARTGVQAMEWCRHREFAALTLDLLLPDMDGLDVLRAIRAGGINREVPIIVVTLVEEKGVTAGFTIQGTLTKPIQTEELLCTLDQLKPLKLFHKNLDI